jgi:hypothetical protein
LKENEGALYQLKKNPENPKEILEFKLIGVKEITHDTKIFTFELPEDMCLGLNVGNHIAIQYIFIITKAPSYPQRKTPTVRKYLESSHQPQISM